MRAFLLLLTLVSLAGCYLENRPPAKPVGPVTRVEQIDPDGRVVLVTRDLFEKQFAYICAVHRAVNQTVEGIYLPEENEIWVVCKDPTKLNDYEMWVLVHEVAHRTDRLWGHDLGCLYWHCIPVWHRTHPEIEARLTEWRAALGPEFLQEIYSPFVVLLENERVTITLDRRLNPRWLAE